jgi:hypothetical protein
MSEAQFEAAIGRMDAEQAEAVRVCIMAERRLRHLFPRDPRSGSALEEAYAWALTAKAGLMPPALDTAAQPSPGTN